MTRQNTRQENRKFKKRISAFKWMANTFIAGALTGAITLGCIQGLSGCKEKPRQAVKSKLEGRVEEEPGIKIVENKIDYETDNFEKDSDKVLLARMLFGEARGCSYDEKIAVGYSVLNRVDDGKKWNGESVGGVVLCPWQYSCFNKNDVNLPKIKSPEKYDKESWQECLKASGDVLNDEYPELNKGQTHYFNPNRANPKWTSKFIDKWSAGCQVLNNPADFKLLIEACEASHLTKFTYTLLREF